MLCPSTTLWHDNVSYSELIRKISDISNDCIFVIQSNANDSSILNSAVVVACLSSNPTSPTDQDEHSLELFWLTHPCVTRMDNAVYFIVQGSLPPSSPSPHLVLLPCTTGYPTRHRTVNRLRSTSMPVAVLATALFIVCCNTAPLCRRATPYQLPTTSCCWWQVPWTTLSRCGEVGLYKAKLRLVTLW